MSSQEASSEPEDFNLAIDRSPSSQNSENPHPPDDTTPTELGISALNAAIDALSEEQQQSPSEKQPDPFELLTEAIRVPAAEAEDKLYSTAFPIARVKTIMRTDPDTSLLQADAVYLMGEAAKLFLGRFSRDVQRITSEKKKKTVSRMDVDTCLSRFHEYEFLDEQLDW